jgi:hypothetical protein
LNVFEFVLGVVVVGLLYKLLVVRMRYKVSNDEQAAARSLARQLDALEERVRVLEQIVTDERHEVRRQFDDLNG